jgi:DNA polymerase III epsilon subunit-like protein
MMPDSTDELRRTMVDIETLGLEPGAAIISIGAVNFGPKRLGETFYASINLESSQEAGLQIDAGTLEWWLEQDEAARDQLVGGEDLDDILESFRDWLLGTDEIWANSPSFDCELLEHAFQAVGLDVPWDFYEERDYRTLSQLPVAPDVEQSGVAHNALDDAEHQAYVAATALHRLEGHEWDDEVTELAAGDRR